MPAEFYAFVGALTAFLIVAEFGTSLWDYLWEYVR